MDSERNLIKPQWLDNFTDFVRPGGVAAMFAVITVLPLIFAMLEIGIEGVGTRLAGVMAGYFKAVPDIFYSTLQVLFLGYVAGKSAEKISGNWATKKDATVNADEKASITINQGESTDGANT